MSVGRATLYGVAAAGRPGADRATEILRTQIDQGLALTGCARVDDLGRGWLPPPHEAAPAAATPAARPLAQGPRPCQHQPEHRLTLAPMTGSPVTKPPLKPVLTLATARAAPEAARAAAAVRGRAVTIAVVDDGGHLLAFERMDGVHPATAEVAQAKARSAALFRRNTGDLAAMLADGATGLMALPGVVPMPGGVPVVTLPGCAGAVGISGAPPAEDGEIATAAAG